ncbi:HAMP domain-containing histidine kinase [Herbiconiux sp. CPCC 203407]|uniref:histidine kinase n=1 Tax=Herbiconiux oxytropis TaxID=2970915 RepID=A0AA41XIZ5_9MICO|nr:HAMP domain-containing sensor histidine kinase [Herbiconiux oxytropis]MCS5723021.1 HAMP domain-containing histidine kinase [Herbiconiux oxytropis]MCS5726910.1 HAMP domain-containing histidine kinase [Herbiconiux oxytropis]
MSASRTGSRTVSTSHRRLRLVGIILIPAAIGLLASLVVALTGTTAEIVTRTALSAVPVLAGTALSLVIAAPVLLVALSRRRFEQGRTQASVDAAESHRRFLSRLDHEMKNPITAIRAVVANIDEPGMREELTSIRHQTARLSKLLDDLRKVSGLLVQKENLEHVDLEAMIDEARALAEVEATAGLVSFTVAFPRAPWPLPLVLADPDLLFIAITNVILNAVKYSRRGGRIEVRAHQSRGFAVLDIADTGIGIAEDETALVFEELARARNSEGIAGSGLGLALVKTIVEQHGGEVTLTSRLDEGTLVQLTLPLADQSTARRTS